MIISEVLEDGTALETYTKAESGLDQLSAVVVRGKIFIDRDGNIELVPDAKVQVTGTGGSIFSGCQQLTSDDEGKYRFVYLLSESQVQLQLKAKKNDLESDLEDVFLQKSDFYRDYVNLELKQESDSTLVIKDLYLSPALATILVGESGSFVARAEYTDGSTKDVTSQASWTGGDDNTVTGKMPDEITLTASYSGRSGSAMVTVKCPEDRPEWNSELGECTSIESAIDSLTEEEETDEYCDEQNMNGEWIQIKQWISKVGMIESGFQIKYNKFMKEINDQNSNVCMNDILAVALAGAKEDMSRFESILEQVKSSSTSLILQLGICPELKLDFGVKDIVRALAQVRPIRSRIVDGMADMQILLADYGCDEQEITERGEEVADNTIDPNIIDDGGAGGEEICGDGKDNDGDGLIDEGCESTGNYNVAIYLYDSGSAKDDIFSLSVSGFGNQGTTPEGGARTYPLYLPPGTYTAFVTVVLAPDDAGTFTITVKQYDRIIAAQSGSPPQGTQISIGFAVEESDAVDADAVMFPASMDMGGEMEIMVFPNEESMGKKGQTGLIRAFPEE
jgi:hypothetical protein